MKSLFQKAKPELITELEKHVDNRPTIFDYLLHVLKKEEYITNLTYGDVMSLMSVYRQATGKWPDSPFELFKEEEE